MRFGEVLLRGLISELKQGNSRLWRNISNLTLKLHCWKTLADQRETKVNNKRPVLGRCTERNSWVLIPHCQRNSLWLLSITWSEHSVKQQPFYLGNVFSLLGIFMSLFLKMWCGCEPLYRYNEWIEWRRSGKLLWTPYWGERWNIKWMNQTNKTKSSLFLSVFAWGKRAAEFSRGSGMAYMGNYNSSVWI